MGRLPWAFGSGVAASGQGAQVAGGTRMRRLSREELAPWLERYRLGELWNSGSLGGNRW